MADEKPTVERRTMYCTDCAKQSGYDPSQPCKHMLTGEVAEAAAEEK